MQLPPAIFFLLSAAALTMPAVAAGQRINRDIEYARTGEHSLKLDLYLPEEKEPLPPLLVYVHGGAWRRGTKDRVPISPLVKRGFAIASVEYRLTPVAPFPANVHDIKAAIRFLRAEAIKFGYDSKKFAIVGSSAGGHLAALVGVTGGNKKLEGDLGGHPRESSSVQAIVSFYGASNLRTILSQSTPHGLRVRVPALKLLLHGRPSEKPKLATLASPVAHVDGGDPPLLLIHGDADPQMPYEQSQELEAAYRKHDLLVELVTIKGGKHGGAEFYDAQRLAIVEEFLRTHLRALPR